jgi:hypothetical protein
MDTALDFGEGDQADLELSVLSASATWLRGGAWTWRASAGLLLDGNLEPSPGSRHEFQSGAVLAVTAERPGRQGAGWSPSLDYSIALSATLAETADPVSDERADYFAADLRLGVRASWQPVRGQVLYTGARVFGGPVSWKPGGRDLTGTDINHYQLALGTASSLGPVGVFAEWAAMGETGFSLGVSSVW